MQLPGSGLIAIAAAEITGPGDFPSFCTDPSIGAMAWGRNSEVPANRFTFRAIPLSYANYWILHGGEIQLTENNACLDVT